MTKETDLLRDKFLTEIGKNSIKTNFEFRNYLKDFIMSVNDYVLFLEQEVFNYYNSILIIKEQTLEEREFRRLAWERVHHKKAKLKGDSEEDEDEEDEDLDEDEEGEEKEKEKKSPVIEFIKLSYNKTKEFLKLSYSFLKDQILRKIFFLKVFFPALQNKKNLSFKEKIIFQRLHFLSEMIELEEIDKDLYLIRNLIKSVNLFLEKLMEVGSFQTSLKFEDISFIKKLSFIKYYSAIESEKISPSELKIKGLKEGINFLEEKIKEFHKNLEEILKKYYDISSDGHTMHLLKLNDFFQKQLINKKESISKTLVTDKNFRSVLAENCLKKIDEKLN
jgi:hypothetical protein